ncbi:hypothetical protein NQD34_017584 [Periophthalmus magnuspinnatus]|nr:hypothetical protein NQD34_017584 [Periophthalmus magnuspinnatus]
MSTLRRLDSFIVCSTAKMDQSSIHLVQSLSMVSLTEEDEEQSLNLSCVVSSPPVEIMVTWLYNNTVLNDDKDRIKITSEQWIHAQYFKTCPSSEETSDQM